MKCTDLPQDMQRLLANMKYISIATICDDGMPWNTFLQVSYDDSLNVFWVSSPDGVHSRNISRDNRVFCTIFDSAAKPGEGVGLYLAMESRIIDSDQEIDWALKIHDVSFFTEVYQEVTFKQGSPNRLYIALPVTVWVNVIFGTKKAMLLMSCGACGRGEDGIYSCRLFFWGFGGFICRWLRSRFATSAKIFFTNLEEEVQANSCSNQASDKGTKSTVVTDKYSYECIGDVQDRGVK